MVVIMLPCLELLTRILQCGEFVDVQTLIAQAPVERLDETVVRGLAGSRVVQLHATSPSPIIKRLGRELGAAIDSDRLRSAVLHCSVVQSLPDALAREPEVRLQ